jgi:hypothetical protein
MRCEICVKIYLKIGVSPERSHKARGGGGYINIGDRLK